MKRVTKTADGGHSPALPLEHKQVALEIKSVGVDGTFEGLASVYETADLGNDLVQVGAFTNSIRDRGAKVKILWQHDQHEPIGTGELSDSREGLLVRGKLSLAVRRAAECHALLRDGVIDGLSIGFQTLKDEIKDGVRRLIELRLWEVSIVTFPMHPGALVRSVKSIGSVRDFERSLHLAGWSRSEAKRLAMGGWAALSQPDESEREESALLEWFAAQ